MKNTFHIFDQSQFPYFTDIDLIVGESSTGDIENSYKLLKENNIYILRPGQGHFAPFFSVKMAEFSEAKEMKASLLGTIYSRKWNEVSTSKLFQELPIKSLADLCR